VALVATPIGGVEAIRLTPLGARIARP
jgi:hypothetical protein